MSTRRSAWCAGQRFLPGSPRHTTCRRRTVTASGSSAPRSGSRRSATAGETPYPAPTAVVRMSLVRKLGYRVNLPHAGDMELWLRLGVNAPVGIIGAVQAFYRQHHVNMNLKYAGLPDLRDRKAVFDTVFAEQGDRIADRDRLFRLAYQGLCESALVEARRASDAIDAPVLGACCVREGGLAGPSLGADQALERRPRWRRRVRRACCVCSGRSCTASVPRQLVPVPPASGSRLSPLDDAIGAEMRQCGWEFFNRTR